MSYNRRRWISQMGKFLKPFSDSRMKVLDSDCRLLSPSSSTADMTHRFQAFRFSSKSLQDTDNLIDRSRTVSRDTGRGTSSRSQENNAESQAFFRKLDKLPKGRDSVGSLTNAYSGSDWLSDGFGLSSDGMTGKLAKAATFFEFDEEEMAQENYSFRPDMSFRMGTTYNVKDLDLSKQRPSRLTKRQTLEVTTKEVLSKADFRNVHFLAKFITEAGIIIKRSQTGISAKAQRKIAREIKTARAFGLLPFTTMGTKSFAFGRSMEPIDRDYEYEPYESFANDGDKEVL